MKAVASMVTAGYTLCDVGTDHGYVPIALVQGNIIPKAIAVDINKGPLERANEHIRANGLTEKITTRNFLSTGLPFLISTGPYKSHTVTVVSSILSHAELSAHGTHLNIG